jgi:hypothetical protein
MLLLLRLSMLQSTGRQKLKVSATAAVLVAIVQRRRHAHLGDSGDGRNSTASWRAAAAGLAAAVRAVSRGRSRCAAAAARSPSSSTAAAAAAAASSSLEEPWVRRRLLSSSEISRDATATAVGRRRCLEDIAVVAGDVRPLAATLKVIQRDASTCRGGDGGVRWMMAMMMRRVITADGP